MRTLRLLLVVCALVVAGAGSTTAAEVELPGLDGGRLTGADLSSGRHVIVVWASWSPRCRDVADRVRSLVGSVGNRARVSTVVFQEDSGTVRGFLGGQSLAAPTYLDTSGSFSKKHGVTTLPGLLVLVDGKPAFSGQLPPDPSTVLANALGR